MDSLRLKEEKDVSPRLAKGNMRVVAELLAASLRQVLSNHVTFVNFLHSRCSNCESFLADVVCTRCPLAMVNFERIRVQ